LENAELFSISINALSMKEIAEIKMNSEKAARYFSFEKEEAKFFGIISTFFSN
jgi:hypothetical protein